MEDAKRHELKVGQSIPNADVISMEALVNVLVKKGLCTAEELFEEELHLRQQQTRIKTIPLVATETMRVVDEPDSRRHKQSWLKRKMAKRRWTRRLGTALFGWKWKKVKIEKKHHSITEQ